ncbi:MAG: DMT family transporter [Candidatus Eremiobacteraeota bacterium]|nr:DMT family transporter [Candidatus Eremiobacteraeota bacterium]
MKPPRSAYTLFAANILVWGYNWVPLHILVHRVLPAPLVAARVAGGALTLAIALLVMRRPLALPQTRWFIPVGLLQVTGMMGLSTYALLLGDVSRTTILLFTMPFWATLFSRYILQERITKRKWAAIAIATFGLIFIAAHASGSRAAIAGALLSVLAGACWAAGSVLAKKHLSHHDLLNGVMWQQIAGAIPLIAFAAALREPLVIPDANTLGLFLFATIAGTGLGWLLWANVLKRVSASAAALGSLGIPLVAAIAAYVQLGERPDSVTLIGLTAILGAIAISSWPVTQK